MIFFRVVIFPFCNFAYILRTDDWIGRTDKLGGAERTVVEETDGWGPRDKRAGSTHKLAPGLGYTSN